MVSERQLKGSRIKMFKAKRDRLRSLFRTCTKFLGNLRSRDEIDNNLMTAHLLAAHCWQKVSLITRWEDAKMMIEQDRALTVARN